MEINKLNYCAISHFSDICYCVLIGIMFHRDCLLCMLSVILCRREVLHKQLIGVCYMEISCHHEMQKDEVKLRRPSPASSWGLVIFDFSLQ